MSIAIWIKLIRIRKDCDIQNVYNILRKIEENSELIATIIGYNSFNIYKPIEFTLQKKNFIEFKIDEEITYNLEDKRFFKFEYQHENDSPRELYFYFGTLYDDFYFYDSISPFMFRLGLSYKILTKSEKNIFR